VRVMEVGHSGFGALNFYSNKNPGVQLFSLVRGFPTLLRDIACADYDEERSAWKGRDISGFISVHIIMAKH